MKFINDQVFIKFFSEIENIRYYPYVGENYKSSKNKILIFAHNIPVKPEEFEKEQIRTASKTHFADAIGEFVYTQEKWTKPFRNFVKGSLGLKINFNKNSSEEVKNKINEHVKSLSYINYINNLVPSKTRRNVKIEKELIDLSTEINNQLYEILATTHIVCWGKPTFDYLVRQKGVKIFEKTSLLTDRKIKKKGFEFAKIHINGRFINVLKVFHPSMPSFGHKKESTHRIFDWFYKTNI